MATSSLRQPWASGCLHAKLISVALGYVTIGRSLIPDTILHDDRSLGVPWPSVLKNPHAFAKEL